MPTPFASNVGSFPLSGQGVLSATNSSVLISTLTKSPGSTDLPNTPTTIRAKVATGGGIAYLLPFGGTASAGNGWPIDPGTTESFNLARPDLATIISASTSTVVFQW